MAQTSRASETSQALTLFSINHTTRGVCIQFGSTTRCFPDLFDEYSWSFHTSFDRILFIHVLNVLWKPHMFLSGACVAAATPKKSLMVTERHGAERPKQRRVTGLLIGCWTCLNHVEPFLKTLSWQIWWKRMEKDDAKSPEKSRDPLFVYHERKKHE